MADDLPQGLTDIVGTNNGQTEEEESDPQARVQQFLKALEHMPGVSNEDKENLAQGLLQGALGGGPQPPVGSPITNPWMRFLVLFGLTTLIVLALGKPFLYNCLNEKYK